LISFYGGRGLRRYIGAFGSHDELGKVRGLGLGVGYLAGACDGPKLLSPNPKLGSITLPARAMISFDIGRCTSGVPSSIDQFMMSRGAALGTLKARASFLGAELGVLA